MTFKSDAMFEEKMTLGSKNNLRNLVNFNASSSKSKNFHFNVVILPKVYYVLAKKEKIILEKYACYAVGLKQSMEGTLKVVGKICDNSLG